MLWESQDTQNGPSLSILELPGQPRAHTRKTGSHGTVSHGLCWSMNSGRGIFDSLQFQNYTSQTWSTNQNLRIIPNDNSKNIFMRMYSPCNKMGRTHSKHSDEALPTQREIVLHHWSSMKYTELHPTGTSGCSHLHESHLCIEHLLHNLL